VLPVPDSIRLLYIDAMYCARLRYLPSMAEPGPPLEPLLSARSESLQDSLLCQEYLVVLSTPIAPPKTDRFMPGINLGLDSMAHNQEGSVGVVTPLIGGHGQCT
jgi:hypothetical protein